jgi:hypothetical protein
MASIFVRKAHEEQKLHMDFQLGDGLGGLMVAGCDGIRLVGSDGNEIDVPKGHAVLFDANFLHAGAAYEEPTTSCFWRLHFYLRWKDCPEEGKPHLHDPRTCIPLKDGQCECNVEYNNET